MSIKTKVAGVVCAACIAASGYVFSNRSITNLSETRIEVQQLAHCAIGRTPVDFVVIDGGRTEAEHKINRANGKSWITRSRHQDAAAIDVAALKNGKISYDYVLYHPIAKAFKSCSVDMGIPMIWGGDWKKAQDLMHFELDKRYYP